MTKIIIENHKLGFLLCSYRTMSHFFLEKDNNNRTNKAIFITEDKTYHPFDTFTQVNNILSVQKIAIKLGKHKHKISTHRKKFEKNNIKGKSLYTKKEDRN